ncbi:MAG: hypothetical protein J1F11_00415 [Oscillospiraceae bacterium]|nr:hypothetical protein [Oscillospiraceae bacterium]
MNIDSILNSTRPISVYERKNDKRDTSFLDTLAQTAKEAPADEDDETEAVEDEIIFDPFEHCLECADRENCRHYLAMTGASEEEIAKADIIIKSPYDKYRDAAHEELSRALRTSIIYNYNIISPEIEKKPKRDR